MFKAEIICNKKEAKDTYLLGLNFEKEVEGKVLPGQFLKLKIDDRLHPLVPRPFTLHEVSGSCVYILYQVRGKVTRLLTRLKKGDTVECLLPLGKPFPVLKDYIICAGGVGVAGFGFLLQMASFNKKYHLPEVFVYGARSKDFLARLEFYKNFGVPMEVATDDGSFGKKAFVPQVLEEVLKEKPRDVLACGPPIMLKKVAELGKVYGVRVYLVMETFLGCGTGFCLGCVIPLKNGGYVHLCKDGPTLLAEEIDLNAI